MHGAGIFITVESQLTELSSSAGSARPDRAHAVGRLVDSLAKNPAVLFKEVCLIRARAFVPLINPITKKPAMVRKSANIALRGPLISLLKAGNRE